MINNIAQTGVNNLLAYLIHKGFCLEVESRLRTQSWKEYENYKHEKTRLDTLTSVWHDCFREGKTLQDFYEYVSPLRFVFYKIMIHDVEVCKVSALHIARDIEKIKWDRCWSQSQRQLFTAVLTLCRLFDDSRSESATEKILFGPKQWLQLKEKNRKNNPSTL
jgi:hypothetical protein